MAKYAAGDLLQVHEDQDAGEHDQARVEEVFTNPDGIECYRLSCAGENCPVTAVLMQEYVDNTTDLIDE